MTQQNSCGGESSEKQEIIARYQAELLDLLHGWESSGDVCRGYEELTQRLGLSNDVGKVDPRMLDLAVHLTKKWGVKSHRSK